MQFYKYFVLARHRTLLRHTVRPDFPALHSVLRVVECGDCEATVAKEALPPGAAGAAAGAQGGSVQIDGWGPPDAHHFGQCRGRGPALCSGEGLAAAQDSCQGSREEDHGCCLGQGGQASTDGGGGAPDDGGLYMPSIARLGFPDHATVWYLFGTHRLAAVLQFWHTKLVQLCPKPHFLHFPHPNNQNCIAGQAEDTRILWLQSR